MIIKLITYAHIFFQNSFSSFHTNSFSLFHTHTHTHTLSLSLSLSLSLRFISSLKDQRVCMYFDTVTYKWSTRGLSNPRDQLNTTSEYTYCETTHLSGFGMKFDFTIAPPKISATNFDPSNSKFIYIVFGSFWAFSLLILLYSWYEKHEYDKYQLAIEQGLIKEDSPAPGGGHHKPPPGCLNNCFLTRTFLVFYHHCVTEVGLHLCCVRVCVYFYVHMFVCVYVCVCACVRVLCLFVRIHVFVFMSVLLFFNKAKFDLFSPLNNSTNGFRQSGPRITTSTRSAS